MLCPTYVPAYPLHDLKSPMPPPQHILHKRSNSAPIRTHDLSRLSQHHPIQHLYQNFLHQHLVIRIDQYVEWSQAGCKIRQNTGRFGGKSKAVVLMQGLGSQ
ncbi:hypothetical protein BDR03DRAFT_949998 [Suillus americanus]|nr:hypothetical protein BDR03DRAFT_949998 [Suillus americanus]